MSSSLFFFQHTKTPKWKVFIIARSLFVCHCVYMCTRNLLTDAGCRIKSKFLSVKSHGHMKILFHCGNDAESCKSIVLLYNLYMVIVHCNSGLTVRAGEIWAGIWRPELRWTQQSYYHIITCLFQVQTVGQSLQLTSATFMYPTLLFTLGHGTDLSNATVKNKKSYRWPKWWVLKEQYCISLFQLLCTVMQSQVMNSDPKTVHS